MKSWLRDHLFANGIVTETGATRTAKPRRCDKCNSPIVIGLDGDMCAFEVHADPMPLSELGEVVALLQGRRVLALHRQGPRWVLDGRDQYDIKAMPAGGGHREDVLAEHRCHQPMSDDLATASTFVSAATSLPPGSPAPF